MEKACSADIGVVNQTEEHKSTAEKRSNTFADVSIPKKKKIITGMNKLTINLNLFCFRPSQL